MEIVITVKEKELPCRPTMGAMLRFKKQTGREVSEMDGESLSDLCTYIYCCVQSACKADGISFDLSFMDFADSIEASDIDAWKERLTQAPSEDESSSDKKNDDKKKE